MESKKLWLQTICFRNELSIDNHQLDLFEQYVTHLLGWNKKINLISRKNEESIWENHILHSISIAFKLRFEEKSSLLDLGTGGGLPGIPLKILFPDLRVTLLDATQKKIHAVKDMVKELALADVQAIAGRAEELAKSPEWKSKFDYVIARAVAPLSDLLKWTSPFLKRPATQEPKVETRNQGSRSKLIPPALITLKGGELDSELQRARSLTDRVRTEVISLVFEGSENISWGEKKLVVVRF